MHEYQSLTTYLDELLNIDKDDNSLFPEKENDKEVHYYVYERNTECYKGKDGNDVQYTRTARAGRKEKVSDLVNRILKNAPRYLRHISYVDNVNHVLPIHKERFSGKYIELDFSENLALRPKHEVQSTHFSGKQHSLHCAIFRPSNTNFHYHLSDDTKHDAFYFDEVLRDLVRRYGTKNEDVVIQSDNASTKYKNRHAFVLLQRLADEFNLRIIRTYGAPGHAKGTVDVMSSFGVKTVLRRDIVAQDIFFGKCENNVDYLNIKNPQFYYAHIDTDMLAEKRHLYTGDCTP